MGKKRPYLCSTIGAGNNFLCCLFVFPFLISFVHGQDYIPETKVYSVKEGLSHRQVNDVIEDKQGFIWIATPAGLSRFDGYSFRIWGTEDGLHSDQINTVFEDAYGFIWALSANNVDLIDPRNNKVVVFSDQYGNKIPDGFKSKVGKPLLTKDSTLYWATDKGFITYHPTRGFRSVKLKTIDLKIVSLWSIDFVSPQKTVWGTVWQPGGHHIIEIDSNGHILQHIKSKNEELSYVRSGRSAEHFPQYYNAADVNNVSASSIRIDGDNSIHTVPSRQMTPHFGYNLYIHTYGSLNDGNLRFSDYCIYKTDEKGILFNFNGISPDVGGKPNSFLIDRSGKIWLGSYFGLVMIDIHKNRFKRYLFNGHSSEKGISCRGILEKDGRLVVNTEGEIFTGDKTTGVFQPYPIVNENKIGMKIFWYSLANGQKGTIYAGWEGGLCELLLPPVQSRKVLGSLFLPWVIFPDQQQRLWIGTYRTGLAVYDLKTAQLAAVTNYNGFDELKTAGIVSIQSDKEGKLWLCATTGLYRLDPQKGVTERHWSGGKGAFYLPYDNIYHFYEDREGVFWIATGGGGLIRWDKKNNKTQQFSRKAGLPNNTVYAVYEDAHKHLWLPSDYGIIQFDKERGNVRRIYLPEDGITHAEFNRISHYRGTDGTLYFGGLNGITAFNPNDFYEKEKGQKIPLVITNFQQFDGDSNQLVDKTGDLLATNEIILNPSDRFFNLEFALLSFNQSDKIQYAYRIEGVDADWSYQNEPRLRLARLPYGTHTLHIRGQAANGLWGSNDLNIKIRVIRPFYLQYWFLLLSLVVIAAAIWLVFKWRTRDLQQNQQRLETEVKVQTEQIRGQAEKLRQLDTLKTRFYTNITHEFRTPLTVIMGTAREIEELGKGNTASPVSKAMSLIQRNSKNLLRLINQLLDLSKLDSGSMKTHLVQADIIHYLQYLVESFYSTAQEKKIRLIFYPETPELVMDFDEEKMQIIVYNLLSNALKFTPESGKVVLHAVQTQQDTAPFLQLKVQDTGVGIGEKELPYIFDRFYQADNSSTRKGEGTGIGLTLTKELVELMGGSIAVESTPGKGTVFSLLFPIKQELTIQKQEEILPVYHPMAPEFLPDFPLAAQENTSLPIDSEKPLLLIIEDNLDVVTYIKGILSNDYQVETATNGKTGIEKALEIIPDIIISDVMMPEKDGYEVCDTLKEDERTSHIPIILLTAKAEQEDKVTGLRAGADAYLQKPFDKSELFVLLEKLIELRKRLQKRYTTSGLTESKDVKPEPAAPTLDDIFLQKIRQVIDAHLDNPELGVEQLCNAVHLSHTQMFRKLKALTGQNPTLFIRKVRLQKAILLLQTSEMNISEIAYTIGFSDPNYFSRVFHEEFGKAPSNIRK